MNSLAKEYLTVFWSLQKMKWHILQHPSVKKYFKATFNIRPPLTKFFFVWNVQIMFECFRGLAAIVKLTQTLFIKTSDIAIASRRATPKLCDSFYDLQNDQIQYQSHLLTGRFLKHSKPGTKLDNFEYQDYSDLKLCILRSAKEYIRRRNDRADQNHKRLFITQRKQFHEALIDTLWRWIEEMFLETRLIVNFTPHGYRSVSTTRKLNKNFEISDILKKRLLSNVKTSL